VLGQPQDVFIALGAGLGQAGSASESEGLAVQVLLEGADRGRVLPFVDLGVAISTAMMAITTSSSISVKPLCISIVSSRPAPA